MMEILTIILCLLMMAGIAIVSVGYMRLAEAIKNRDRQIILLRRQLSAQIKTLQHDFEAKIKDKHSHTKPMPARAGGLLAVAEQRQLAEMANKMSVGG